jgi:hypothetical protein
MGFYLRQSARLGPFRINFSKSGIGVSAGIPGFRLGTGPRGAYVHAGMAGLYYRQSLGSPGSSTHQASGQSAPTRPVSPSPIVPSEELTLGAVDVIDSGNVLQMRDGTDSSLIDALEQCRRRIAFAPFAFAIAVGLLLFAFWKQSWILAMFGMICIPLAIWIRAKDIERKGFILQYDLDDGAQAAASNLVETWEQIGAVSKTWYLDQTQAVLDSKYHAGASSVVKRSDTRAVLKDPPYLIANVPIAAVNVGKETLYFLPDRLLVYSGDAIGAVSYRDLKIVVENTQFIESSGSSVPSDAEVVGRTWRYVNKKGGPDRRFKDNPELPIVVYEKISFDSSNGLREIVQLSKRGLGEKLASAVSRLNASTASGKVTGRPAHAGQTQSAQTFLP